MYSIIFVNLATVFAMVLLWAVIFGLFTAKSNMTIASIALLIVMCAAPYIYRSTYNGTVELSKMSFEKHANGEVQLAWSPLKIPDGTTNYCKQFTDQDGKPLNSATFIHNASYCGLLFYFYKEEVPMIPYKLLPNGKAEYWVGLESRIIGRPPAIAKAAKQ